MLPGKESTGLYCHRIISASKKTPNKQNLWLFNNFSPSLMFVSYHWVPGHLTCHIGSWLLFSLLPNAKNESLDSLPYPTTY